MACRITLLLFVCLLPVMVAGIRQNKSPFCVKGRIYCDPCRFGFESSATTYIAGATVILQCKDKAKNDIVFSKQGKTDSSGAYTIYVDEDHENQICDVKLLSTPQRDCKEATPGRDKARVILNRFNGIATDDRFVNNMGFMKEEVASGCADILREYEEFDSQN